MPQALAAVNDFVVKFANVNGSGSASANELFARAILRMGVPVSPRNIFPSNIQGLPTWYEVRVTEKGYLGRRGGVDMMVAMNPQTWGEDVKEIEPGGYLFYDSTKPMPSSMFREDINVVGVPLTAITNATYTDARQRQLFKNIIYVGALSVLLDIDENEIKRLFGEQFKGKEKLLDSNVKALNLGRDWIRQHGDPDGVKLKIRRADNVGDRIFVEGNNAAALGAVYGGATVCAWYPITPSSSLAEAFQGHCMRLRHDKESGKAKYAIVQAEDELASIGIVIGAGWNGSRAFTSTSGPGISLMTEFIGLASFAEVPAVIINVQRGGPSTGMPTRTQQSDLLSCAYASNGDTKHVLLFPEDPKECFDFAADALDLADRLQTPVFVMSDLDIGMNHRLCKPFVWDDKRAYDRGKVMTAEELDAGKNFGRYLDVDGDGIPFRTYPGTHPTRGSFFTRGTTKDEYARYSEAGPVYVRNMERLQKKFATAAKIAPQPLRYSSPKPTRYGVIYFGSTSPAMDEALDHLEADGDHVNALRVRAFPFAQAVEDFIHEHDKRVRRRAEPRRPAPFHDHERVHARRAQARSRPALRRHADHGALHRGRHRQEARPVQGGFVRKGGVMTYIAKPKLHHPSLVKNKAGYTRRDYEGAVSTLCAGCGHDSISAAIIQACYELDILPHQVAKLSGIGCSSKAPTYFVGASHGFNTVHGRMPSVMTGANLANRDLLYMGVSGDGDSASIGLGQFAHIMRRGVNMTYIVMNNGVYGLTKGQFSATADKGSISKKGVANSDESIDLVSLAILMGATFVGRSFSGDKHQLVPLIKAAMAHKGAAFLDVVSPCVAFNNHSGSTKSYDYVREHNEALNRIDFIESRDEITTQYDPGTLTTVQQHDGSILRLRKLGEEYDPSDKVAAMKRVQESLASGEVVTGLLYVDPTPKDLHHHLNTVEAPLNTLDTPDLCPGPSALDRINASLR